MRGWSGSTGTINTFRRKGREVETDHETRFYLTSRVMTAASLGLMPLAWFSPEERERT